MYISAPFAAAALLFFCLFSLYKSCRSDSHLSPLFTYDGLPCQRTNLFSYGGLYVTIRRRPANLADIVINDPELIFWEQNGAAVYIGKYPDIGNTADKPLLVFVPGLGKSAPYFWEENAMYQKAYFNGFRTAFVSFCPQGEKPQDMWKNGEFFTRQLEDICAYYHVPRCVVIAHSKGGVDAQSAAVHYGASKRIERILTLSSPHHGSQLADIAYSTIGWGVADLMRVHSPGCYCMQTGFMDTFREMTDNSAKNVTPILTFAGSGGTDASLRLRATTLLLDRYGENDGIVTVKSAHNPKGRHLDTLQLNHAQMGDGRFVWPHLLRALGENVREPHAAEAVVAASATPISTQTAQILRGGALQGGIDEQFYIDGTVESFTVHLLVAGAARLPRFTLIAPGGQKTDFLAKKDGVLTIFYATINKPQIAKWRLTADRCDGAYTAVISLRGSGIFPIHPKSAAAVRTDAELRIVKTLHNGYEIVGEYGLRDILQIPVPPNLENCIYNLEVRFFGELEDGSSFERSLLHPLLPCRSIEELVKEQ